MALWWGEGKNSFHGLLFPKSKSKREYKKVADYEHFDSQFVEATLRVWWSALFEVRHGLLSSKIRY